MAPNPLMFNLRFLGITMAPNPLMFNLRFLGITMAPDPLKFAERSQVWPPRPQLRSWPGLICPAIQ